MYSSFYSMAEFDLGDHLLDQLFADDDFESDGSNEYGSDGGEDGDWDVGEDIDKDGGEDGLGPYGVYGPPGDGEDEDAKVERTIELSDELRKQVKEKIHAVSEKLKIVMKYRKAPNKTLFAQLVSLEHRRLVRWNDKYEEMLHAKGEATSGQSNIRKRSRSKGAGRKPRFHDVEVKVHKYYRQRKEKKLPVPKSVLRSKYKELLVEDGKLKTACTDKIFYAFMKRYKLSRQKVKRLKPMNDTKRVQFANRFFAYLEKAHNLYKPTRVIMWDESPITPLGDSISETINDVGTEAEILSAACPADLHQFATVLPMLTDVDEEKELIPQLLLVMVFFKGVGHKAKVEAAEYHRQTKVIWNKLTTFNNADMIMADVIPYQQKFMRSTKSERPILNVYDSCPSHLKPSVTNAMRDANFVPAIIPNGMTSDLQLLDTAFFGRFKQRGHSCSTVKDILYTFGGITQQQESLNSVFTYSMALNQWDEVLWTDVSTHGPSGRRGHSMVTVEDCLVIFGGCDQ
eukprot:gene21404-143_t